MKRTVIGRCRSALILLLAVVLAGCSGAKPASVYADAEGWAYAETDVTDKTADVFFVTPTVYLGTEDELSWDSYDEETKASFVGAINMEKGIYDDDARFFAPFYHQAALSAYYAPAESGAAAFDTAYADVKEAFDHYMANWNGGRPLILAGFSQGAQMCIRLLEEYAGDPTVSKVLVACYAIGWRFTEEEQAQYPQVKFAQGERDTGVLIAFNSEAPDVSDSLMIPAGTRTLAINPLNWSTDGQIADKTCNLGACFTDYDGNIVTELPQLTGAYIDDVRGALKVTDVSPEEYPGVLFPDGIYHLYDYQFFYRNLEENVQERIRAFVGE